MLIIQTSNIKFIFLLSSILPVSVIATEVMELDFALARCPALVLLRDLDLLWTKYSFLYIVDTVTCKLILQN